jgi:hypothetical protein
MPVRNETSTRFMDEIRVISPWAYFFAFLGFAAAGAAIVFATLTDRTGDRFYTLPVLLPLGLLGGIIIACYVLLIGYVNGDAARRGMSRLGWTLLAIFIPHARYRSALRFAETPDFELPTMQRDRRTRLWFLSSIPVPIKCRVSEVPAWRECQ